MNHRMITVLVITLLSSIRLLAYPFTIEGKVIIPPTLDVAPNSIPVSIYQEGALIKHIVYVDAGLQFRANFEIEGESNIPFIVELPDLCTGELIQQRVESEIGEVALRFSICNNSLNCSAWFAFEIDDLSVAFFDESGVDVLEYLWDFGDLNESMQPMPTHTYDQPGVYEVTLQILTVDSCKSRIVQTISLGSSCSCPEYYFEVCAMDADGNIKRFDNPCFAACEGYDILIACQDSCNCSDTLDIVCAEIGAGIANFKNACHAQCLGLEPFDCGADCICPHIYDPVCVATPSGQILTFGNKCLAECAGYLDISYPCVDTCICPDIYLPVCVLSDTGDTLEFGNECEAHCAGYFDFVECDSNFFCPQIYDPVCVITSDGQFLTFENQCLADLAGYGDKARPCPDTTCGCPFTLDPVCVMLDDGTTTEFPNECVANCAGFFDFVACDTTCICPTVFDPVCVLTVEGEIIQFGNACEAKCQGYEEYVSCQPDCYCFSNHFDPVCVRLDDGSTLTFVNDCFALCAGYAEFDTCNFDTTCICDDVFDPVCYYTDNGIRLEFPNLCYAECAGFPDAVPCFDGACPCPRILDPVCAIDPLTGQVQQFDNECLAKCAGFEELIDCSFECDCSDESEPVCFQLLEGVKIVFENRCIAECFGLNDLESCGRGTDGQTASPEGLETEEQLLHQKAFHVFPNPSSGDINIAFNTTGIALENALLTIMDQTGKIFIQSNFDNLNSQIATSRLPSGIYIIRLETKSTITSQMFIKQ